MPLDWTRDDKKERDKDLRDLYPFSISNSESSSPIPISMIAVVAADGAIGRNGDLLWHIPEDLRHFKEVTLGSAVIMGRKTWMSLPSRPLKGRMNIVLSRNDAFLPDGALGVCTPEEAVEVARGNEIFIIGGGLIYKKFMPLASKLILTEVDAVCPDADTFFPTVSPDEWHVAERTPWMKSSKGLNYRFTTYLRNA